MFKTESDYPQIATTDLNAFVLDGSLEVASDRFRLPYLGSLTSDADCTFSDIPTFTISFSEKHTSVGLTIRFLNEHPRKMRVTWYYDSSCTIAIASDVFTVDSLNFYCEHQITDYKGIKIEFLETMHPGESIKVAFIQYGHTFVWADDDIMSASVNEEIDPTSATIPINTCEIKFVDENDDFNVQNNDGLWQSIQANQKMDVKENVNGKNINVGTFFVKSWTSSNNTISFELEDALGLIDKKKFNGRFYTNEKVENIVKDIMLASGYADYELSIDSVTLSGYLGSMTCREALQQVAFSCGAVVDCSRGSTIRIYVPDKNVDSYILTDRKFLGKTSAELDDEVSGISITCTKYVKQTETTEIYNGHLDIGTHTIEFSEPYTNLSISGGVIGASGTNYAIIDVSTSGDVILSGIGYDEVDFTITRGTQNDKVKSFSGLTLYNNALLPQIADRLLDYYSLRQKVSLEYICESERVGEWVAIEDASRNGSYAITKINSQRIDLTGGFLASADCRGYSTVVSTYYLMGNDELYMNDEGVI